MNDMCNFQIVTSKDKTDLPLPHLPFLSALIWKGAVMAGARAAIMVHKMEVWLRR